MPSNQARTEKKNSISSTHNCILPSWISSAIWTFFSSSKSKNNKYNSAKLKFELSMLKKGRKILDNKEKPLPSTIMECFLSIFNWRLTSNLSTTFNFILSSLTDRFWTLVIELFLTTSHNISIQALIQRKCFKLHKTRDQQNVVIFFVSSWKTIKYYNINTILTLQRTISTVNRRKSERVEIIKL